MTRADLILQYEVARKRSDRPRTALSAAWSPWWTFRLGRKIPRTAFRPQPTVDAGVLVIERRPQPLLDTEAANAFATFSQALFAGTLARDLDPNQWMALYRAYVSADEKAATGSVKQGRLLTGTAPCSGQLRLLGPCGLPVRC
jgi:16S rRNA A1518/A1519 N6-dimethyltransferase RsmA/KsgA/DIM1 with predicted DNA glycosylase/AP lyase activity